MSTPGPRAGGPSRRRTFTPAEKLDFLTGYEQAITEQKGGAYLRENGIYSSQIAEWRKQRDAGVLEGKTGRTPIGKLSPEQAEIARLRRQLEVSEGKRKKTEEALDINGKTLGVLRERHQRVLGRAEAQEEMTKVYHQLVALNIPTRRAAALAGVSRTTMYRKPAAPQDAPRPAPPNKLSDAERAAILAALNSTEFVDLSPLQVDAKLLDEGIYLGSLSSFYRVLGENRLVKERRRLAKHQPRAIPELEATAPGQVYSWDITKLAGPVKGKYYDCYVMLDIYSRFIVGAHVHATESGVLAVEMMEEIFGVHGVPQVVHADRGTSMTSKTVAALLADLEVTRSHSRPRVSNDNPFSESLFKTMKYAPVFPERFGSLPEARGFIGEFVAWYNHEHQHSGLGLHTSANVHHGLADSVAVKRSQTLAAARARNPERFSKQADPKILAMPDTAWINNPNDRVAQAA
ncbi:IS3 family transposase [Glutamicibacter sp. X7]